jgi:hypothetical protein
MCSDKTHKCMVRMLLAIVIFLGVVVIAMGVNISIRAEWISEMTGFDSSEPELDQFGYPLEKSE